MKVNHENLESIEEKTVERVLPNKKKGKRKRKRVLRPKRKIKTDVKKETSRKKGIEKGEFGKKKKSKKKETNQKLKENKDKRKKKKGQRPNWLKKKKKTKNGGKRKRPKRRKDSGSNRQSKPKKGKRKKKKTASKRGKRPDQFGKKTGKNTTNERGQDKDGKVWKVISKHKPDSSSRMMLGTVPYYIPNINLVGMVPPYATIETGFTFQQDTVVCFVHTNGTEELWYGSAPADGKKDDIISGGGKDEGKNYNDAYTGDLIYSSFINPTSFAAPIKSQNFDPLLVLLQPNTAVPRHFYH